MPAAHETLGELTIQVEPLRLKIWTFIPVKAEPGHRIEDAASHLFARAFDVRIFDPQYERAVVLSSE